MNLDLTLGAMVAALLALYLLFALVRPEKL